MIKTIPAQNIFICDVCKKEDQPRKHSAVFTIKRDALDYQGSPCADGTFKFDACDKCHGLIAEAINVETKRIQEEQ